MSKAKGARTERKAKKILESAGYFVIKAGASLGEWDLVAIGKKQCRLIQVKTNRRPGRVEMEQMREFKSPNYATKELWVWKDYAREPIIEELL